MLKRLLSDFKRSWSKHIILSISTLTTLVGSYVVLLLFLLGSANLRDMMVGLGEDVEVTVYLKPQVDAQTTQEVVKGIEETPGLQGYQFISSEQAGRQIEEQMRHISPGLLDDEDFKVAFPASFRVQLKAGLVGQENWQSEMKGLAESLRRLSGVEDVVYGQEWLKNYRALVRGFSAAFWTIGTVLMLGCFFVVGNAVKSSIFQRRHEIEVLEMIGATTRMIRAPFLFEGAVFGLLASFIALLICYGIFSWAQQLLVGDLRFLALGANLKFYGLASSLAAVSGGVVIGVVAAYLNVRSINTGWASARADG